MASNAPVKIGKTVNSEFEFGFGNEAKAKQNFESNFEDGPAQGGFRKSRKNDQIDDFANFDDFGQNSKKSPHKQKANPATFDDPFADTEEFTPKPQKQKQSNPKTFDPFNEDPFAESSSDKKSPSLSTNLQFGQINIKQVESFAKHSANDSSLGGVSHKKANARGLKQTQPIIKAQDPKLLQRISKLEEELRTVRQDQLAKAINESQSLKRIFEKSVTI